MILNRLHAAHLHAWRPPVVPTLTTHHIANRRECVGSIRPGVFIAGHVSCCQMSPHSLDFLDRHFYIWWWQNEQHDVFFRTNCKCSPPTVQHLANAMDSNDPKCFPHWTYLGHDRETYVSTLKTADHISWTWSGAAKGVEQTHSCQLNECLTNCGSQPSNFTSDINRPSRTLPTVILNFQL